MTATRGRSAADVAPELLAASAAVEAQALRDPTPSRRRAAAVALLLVGDQGHAVGLLAALARERPQDAGLQSDLAAAYLVTAAQHPEHHPRALEAAQRALELAPELQEARFNRALALEGLGLSELARDAWRDVAAATAGSGWAQEANDHLLQFEKAMDLDPAVRERLLAHALAAGDEAELRRQVEGSVDTAFTFYLDHLPLPDVEAGPRFDVALLGRVFREVTGDEAIALGAAHVYGGKASAAETRAALVEFQAARAAMERFEWSAAAPKMARSAAALRRVGSPLRGWAALYAAILDVSASRFAAGEAALAVLLADPAFRGQPLLRARALYARSVSSGRQGEWGKALGDRRAARELFVAARDRAWAGFMSEQVAEVYGVLGRASTAWPERMAAVSSVSAFASLPRAVLALSVVGDDCNAAGLPRAARQFYRAALRLAERHGDQVVLSDTLLGMAPSLATVDPDEFARTLDRAKTAIEAIPDPALRERYRGELLRVRAEGGSGPLTEQEAALDEAIRWFESRREPGRAFPLREARARLLVDAGRESAAEADLSELVRLSSGRELGTEVTLSSSSLRSALYAFEFLAASAARADRTPADVLSIAERRWQTAFRRRLAAPHSGLARELTARLAHDVCVLAFLPTERRLLSWSICAGQDVHMCSQDMPRAALADLVQRAVAAAQSRAPETATADLWTVLLTPHRDAIGSRRRLFVVGSGPLSRVPWATLGPAGGADRPREVSIAPSLEFVLTEGAKPSEPPAPSRAVGIGVSFGERELRPLPQAPSEAALAVTLAGGGTVLRDEAATLEAVTAAVRKAAILHFAGHGLINLDSPGQSSLVLSNGGQVADYWTLDQIVGERLGNVSLVVVSACRSADTASTDGDAELSLARGFLEAGAANVVGMLWDVSDDEMPRVMRPLYTALFRDRQSPAAAMATIRNAQAPVDARALVLHSARGALAR